MFIITLLFCWVNTKSIHLYLCPGMQCVYLKIILECWYVEVKCLSVSCSLRIVPKSVYTVHAYMYLFSFTAYFYHTKLSLKLRTCAARTECQGRCTHFDVNLFMNPVQVTRATGCRFSIFHNFF